MGVLLILTQLWTSMPQQGAILSGNWQSCLEGREWGELAYDHRNALGIPDWSFHLGPYDEFALFRANTEPDEDNHFIPENLLRGPRALKGSGVNGGRQWNIPSLNLWISVVQAGGNRDDCRSWYILITPLKTAGRGAK